MAQPTPEQIREFRALLEVEGPEKVRRNLRVLVIYGDRNNWRAKEGELWLEELDRATEETHRNEVLATERRGTKWSGWTAIFTFLIAVFTALLVVVAVMQGR